MNYLENTTTSPNFYDDDEDARMKKLKILN